MADNLDLLSANEKGKVQISETESSILLPVTQHEQGYNTDVQIDNANEPGIETPDQQHILNVDPSIHGENQSGGGSNPNSEANLNETNENSNCLNESSEGIELERHTHTENHHIGDGDQAAEVLPTTDILRQALVEASGGDISHIAHSEDTELYSTEKQDAHTSVSTANLTDGTVLTGTPVDNVTQNDVQANLSIKPPATPQPILPAPPLGSKTNPIRIIQQGNTYTSTQKLSEEQIQQIVKVLQRQNIASKCVDGESTAVYNPETNTRIVYRVVQPHSKAGDSNVPSAKSGALTARDYHRAKYGTLGRRGKGKSRKRPRRESDEEESSGEEPDEPVLGGDSDSDGGDMAHVGRQELSPTEKLRKKREKPITRAGRISKPPTHMVKDYKQIHRVDWYEDYDDSDGGYSDIYDSGNEAGPGNAGKAKAKGKFPCPKCEKSYVGPRNLARHYKLTGHGDPADLLIDEEDNSPSATPADPASHSTINVTELDAAATPAATVSLDSVGTLADATPISTGDITNTTTGVTTSTTNTPGVAASGGVATPMGRGRGRGRGKRKNIEDLPWRPPSYARSRDAKVARTDVSNTPGSSAANKMSMQERRARRTQKLTNILGSFSCAEILEAALPRLKKDKTSLYDILVAGLAAPPGERPSYTRMLQLYTELQGKMTMLAQLCLRPITKEEQVSEDKEAIQITTESIAHSLGIQPGLFEVSDLPEPIGPQPGKQAEAAAATAAATDAATDGNASQSAAVAAPAVTPGPELSQSTSDGKESSRSLLAQTTMSLTAPASQQNLVTETQTVTDTTSPMDVDPKPTENSMLPETYAGSEIPAVDANSQLATTHSSLAEIVSRILPGDIIQLDGQKIVIPEGASIVQTEDGIMIYESNEPGAASVLNLKVAPDI